MDGHFSDILRLLKNGQKSDSCAAHFKQKFIATTSHIDLRKNKTFQVVKHLNPIGAMKTFTKPSYNLCMEECLTILKILREKHFIIMNKNLEIYRSCRHKTTFYQFFLSTDDPVFNR